MFYFLVHLNTQTLCEISFRFPANRKPKTTLKVLPSVTHFIPLAFPVTISISKWKSNNDRNVVRRPFFLTGEYFQASIKDRSSSYWSSSIEKVIQLKQCCLRIHLEWNAVKELPYFFLVLHLWERRIVLCKPINFICFPINIFTFFSNASICYQWKCYFCMNAFSLSPSS